MQMKHDILLRLVVTIIGGSLVISIIEPQDAAVFKKCYYWIIGASAFAWQMYDAADGYLEEAVKLKKEIEELKKPK